MYKKSRENWQSINSMIQILNCLVNYDRFWFRSINMIKNSFWKWFSLSNVFEIVLKRNFRFYSLIWMYKRILSIHFRNCYSSIFHVFKCHCDLNCFIIVNYQINTLIDAKQLFKIRFLFMMRMMMNVKIVKTIIVTKYIQKFETITKCVFRFSSLLSKNFNCTKSKLKIV